jgi:hypothetical protein
MQGSQALILVSPREAGAKLVILGWFANALREVGVH